VVVEDFNFIGGRGDAAVGGADQSAQSDSKSQDVVIDDIDDKPIDLSEIPF